MVKRAHPRYQIKLVVSRTDERRTEMRPRHHWRSIWVRRSASNCSLSNQPENGATLKMQAPQARTTLRHHRLSLNPKSEADFVWKSYFGKGTILSIRSQTLIQRFFVLATGNFEQAYPEQLHLESPIYMLPKKSTGRCRRSMFTFHYLMRIFNEWCKRN